MTSSAPSSIRETFEAYLAGRVKAERVAAVVAEAYYGGGAGGTGKQEGLRPLMEIIERAHPGIVTLAGAPQRPGYSVQLAERPFPKECEAALRQAVEVAVGSAPPPPAAVRGEGGAESGWLGRLVGAIRRLFSASS
jgi:hypothetical protein